MEEADIQVHRENECPTQKTKMKPTSSFMIECDMQDGDVTGNLTMKDGSRSSSQCAVSLKCDTVHQPQGQSQDLLTGITVKNTGCSVKRRFSANESQCHNMSPNKMVMNMTKAFNEGHDWEMDICLNHQEVAKENLNLDRILVERKNILGKGAFGQVFPIKLQHDKRMIVKEIYRKKSKVNHNEITVPLALSLSQKGIVEIVALKCWGDYFWIMMKDAGKPLNQLLRDDAFIQWSQDPKNLRNIASQLFNIIWSLERYRIMHRDIKPENLCMLCRDDGQLVVTLIDFGSVQPAQEKASSSGHTPEYLTPYLNWLIYSFMTFQNQPCLLGQEAFENEKCDVWGIGMVLLTIVNKGGHPLEQVNSYSSVATIQERKAVMREIIKLHEGYFEPLLEQIKEPLQHVLRKVLLMDRKKAWTAKMACSYLTELKFQKVYDSSRAPGTSLEQDPIKNFLDRNCQQKKSKNICQVQFPPANLAVSGGCFSPSVTATSPSTSEQDLFINGVPASYGAGSDVHGGVGGEGKARFLVVGIGGPTDQLTTHHHMICRANYNRQDKNAAATVVAQSENNDDHDPSLTKKPRLWHQRVCEAD